LSTEEYDVVSRHYGLDRTPNFEGSWHLHVFRNLEEIAEELKMTLDSAQQQLNSARKKLLIARETRIHPGRDEKILTSWNGLMIKGMAVAGRRLGRADFIVSAENALAFVRETLWVDGRLLATCKDNKAHLMAYLDDYVFLIDGILSLLEARWRNEDIEFAIELMDVVLQHFQSEDGGFYFTADDHEQLIQRPRPWMDEATPAGNGIAAQVLLRLGYLLGNADYLEAAEETLHAAWHEMKQFPHAHNSLLTALEEFLSPTETVVIRGPNKESQVWVKTLAKDYVPSRLVLPIPDEAPTLPETLADYEASQTGVAAYVCRKVACLPPIFELDQLKKILSGDTM
jgi:uncharacterized protein YyaL (SSP411 family)